MASNKQIPRRLLFRRATAAIATLLLIAAAAAALRGHRPKVGEALEQALMQSSALCCPSAREAAELAAIESEQASVRYIRETTALFAKRLEDGAPDSRKAFDPRQTPYGPEGTAGRLIIPSAEINVALYLSGEDAQATADAEDSACWMEFRSDLNGVIGDHVNQDFSALFRVAPGDECIVCKSGREHRYICVSTGYGSNIETDVLDAEGNSLFECGEDMLCMYTCANGWRYVFYAKWRSADARPLHQYEASSQTLIFQMEEDEG